MIEIDRKIKKTKENDSYTMIIKPTHACNIFCEYCYDRAAQDKHGTGIMSMPDFKRIVDMMNRDKRECSEFTWHGGEPLVPGKKWYRNTMEYLMKNLNRTPSFNIQSNGTLLDEEFIKILADYNINLGLSYDFESQELGIKSLRPNMPLEQLLKVIEWTEKYNASPIGIIMVINKSNYMHLKEAEDFFDGIGIPFSFNFMYPTSSITTEEDKALFYSHQEYTNMLIKYLQERALPRDDRCERGLASSISFMYGGANSCCNRSNCDYGWVGLGPDGTFAHCDTYSYGPLYLGTIYDFDEITDFQYSKGYTNVVNARKDVRRTRCSHCKLNDICTGTCFSNMLNEKSNGITADNSACLDLKYSIYAMYKGLRDYDIFGEDNLNGIIKRHILSCDYYTFNEINSIFEEVYGINLKSLNEHSLDSPISLFESVEWDIFRIINPAAKKDVNARIITFNQERDFHEDFQAKAWDRLSVLDLYTIKFQRRKSILLSIRSNLDNINKILSRYNLVIK